VFALARRTGVKLFDYHSIEKWVRQAENKSDQVKQTDPVDQGSVHSKKQASKPSSSPSSSPQKPKVIIRVGRGNPPTNAAARRTDRVGDTATRPSGNRLTLYSYESPVAAPTRQEPEEGYEFVALT
jgi:hypothetical protein